MPYFQVSCKKKRETCNASPLENYKTVMNFTIFILVTMYMQDDLGQGYDTLALSGHKNLCIKCELQMIFQGYRPDKNFLFSACDL